MSQLNSYVARFIGQLMYAALAGLPLFSGAAMAQQAPDRPPDYSGRFHVQHERNVIRCFRAPCPQQSATTFSAVRGQVDFEAPVGRFTGLPVTMRGEIVVVWVPKTGAPFPPHEPADGLDQSGGYGIDGDLWFDGNTVYIAVSRKVTGRWKP